MFRECVRLLEIVTINRYSQSIDISKIYLHLSTKYLSDLRSPTTTMSFHRARRVQILFLWWRSMRGAGCGERIPFDGPPRDVDCFYLCQTYARIPKHLIRDNANLLILFKQDCTNLKYIYNDHVNTDMSYDEFCLLCRNCWQKKIWIFSDKQGQCA